MPIGTIFWMLMIIWAVFGFAWNSNPSMLGWHAVGLVIHGQGIES